MRRGCAMVVIGLERERERGRCEADVGWGGVAKLGDGEASGWRWSV